MAANMPDKLDALREAQNRMVMGYENPHILPIDADQWARLKDNVEGIGQAPPTNNNVMWTLTGSGAGLAGSLLFYLFSETPDGTAVALAIGLILACVVGAIGFGRASVSDRAQDKMARDHCLGTIDAIERRFRADSSRIIRTAPEALEEVRAQRVRRRAQDRKKPSTNLIDKTDMVEDVARDQPQEITWNVGASDVRAREVLKAMSQHGRPSMRKTEMDETDA